MIPRVPRDFWMEIWQFATGVLLVFKNTGRVVIILFVSDLSQFVIYALG